MFEKIEEYLKKVNLEDLTISEINTLVETLIMINNYKVKTEEEIKWKNIINLLKIGG